MPDRRSKEIVACGSDVCFFKRFKESSDAQYENLMSGQRTMNESLKDSQNAMSVAIEKIMQATVKGIETTISISIKNLSDRIECISGNSHDETKQLNERLRKVEEDQKVIQNEIGPIGIADKVKKILAEDGSVQTIKTAKQWAIGVGAALFIAFVIAFISFVMVLYKTHPNASPGAVINITETKSEHGIQGEQGVQEKDGINSQQYENTKHKK